jgi:hypothetical protein
MKMETVYFFETFVSAGRNNPEEQRRHLYRLKILKRHTAKKVL